MCKDPRCHHQTESKAFRVLRSQLSQVNVFYPSDSLGCTNVSDKKGEVKEGMELQNDPGEPGIACTLRNGTGEEWTNDHSNISDSIDTLPLNVLAPVDEPRPQFHSANEGTEDKTSDRETVTASSKAMPPSGEYSHELLQQGMNDNTHKNTDQQGLVVKAASTEITDSNTTGEVTSQGLMKSCDKYTGDVATSQTESEASSPAAHFERPLPPLLCVVCGCLGPKKCGRCKQVSYCSRQHQIHDWKSGHKLFCSDLASGKVVTSDQAYVPG